MALPESVQVKLISDEAGTISISPVVVRDMPLDELIELAVSQSGKDTERVCELLRRGTLLQGASRYRWQGFDTAPVELGPLLAKYPEPQPDRAFNLGACGFVVLHFSLGGSVELEKESLMKRRFLRRASFWNVLERFTAAHPPQYAEYSYREKADRYRLTLEPNDAAILRDAAAALPYANLAHRLKTTAVGAVDFYSSRG